MYGVMRLSQSVNLAPQRAVLATVWRSPQAEQVKFGLVAPCIRNSVVIGRAVDARPRPRSGAWTRASVALAAQASTANGIRLERRRAEHRFAISDGVAAARKAFGPDRAKPLRVDRLGRTARPANNSRAALSRVLTSATALRARPARRRRSRPPDRHAQRARRDCATSTLRTLVPHAGRQKLMRTAARRTSRVTTARRKNRRPWPARSRGWPK